MNNPLHGDSSRLSDDSVLSENPSCSRDSFQARDPAIPSVVDGAGEGHPPQPLPAAGVIDVQTACGQAGSASSLARFRITAEIETSVLPRLLNQFALRGLIPADLRAWIADDRLHVDLSVAGLSGRECDHLVQRLGVLVPVCSVDGGIAAP